MSTAIFFLLSSITGIVEVGAVLYAIGQDFSVAQVLMLVFAYQMGCFFPTNITVKKTIIIILGVTSIICSVSYILFPSFFLFLFAVLFISPCLQTARSFQKSSISTGIKRVFRILGFALAPLFSLGLLSALSIIVLIITAIQRNDNTNKFVFPNVVPKYLIMIVHQMHYFSYAYIVLIIASTFDKYSGFLTALIFVLGWVTYTSAQYIFRKKKFYTYLLCGHIFLVFAIGGIAILNSEAIKVALWILTGFGGGTVFCIKEILRKHSDFDNHALESSENYGHILGVLCSLILFALFKTINAPIYFAALCAAGTALLAFVQNSNPVKGGLSND